MKTKALIDLKHVLAKSIRNPAQLIGRCQLGVTPQVAPELVEPTSLTPISDT